jgi:hypothetical protein
VKIQKKLFWHIQVDLRGIWNNFFFVLTVRRRLGWKLYRTSAGHTAKKKTRRKGNRGYQGLLFVAQQPSPPPPPHMHRAPVGLPGAALSGHIPPPSKYVHTDQNQWFLGKAAKRYDSLFLETQEWCGWIRTAFVILYKLELSRVRFLTFLWKKGQNVGGRLHSA